MTSRFEREPLPDHVETWLTERYPRRRIDWAGVVTLVAIAAVIVALVVLLNRPIVTGY